MIVKFYKTKLSAQNRCYDKAAYDRYLAGCVKETVDIPADIIPNTTFYVPPYIRNGTTVTGAIQWQKYNYIEYVYAGMKYGSFITSIQPLAANSTVAISHSTDNWYYLLQNFTDSNGNPEFDMHGQVNRAHVNDMIKSVDVAGGKTYVPYMGNTYLSPECSCSATGFKTEYKKITPFDSNKPDSWHYIYILVNNPNATGFAYGPNKAYEDVAHQYSISPNGESIRTIQMLMTGVVNDDGLISFYTYVGNSALTTDVPPGYDSYLINLKDENITKILISDIPPNPRCSIKKDNKGIAYIFYYDANSKYSVATGETQDLVGFPSKFSIIQEFEPSKVYFFPSAPDYTIYTGNTLVDELDNTKEAYKNYGVCKLRSPAYATLYYCGKYIDYSQYKSKDYASKSLDIKVEYSQDISFQFYSYAIDGLVTVDKRTSFGLVNCTNGFDNLVQKSYFDKYDLSLATSNAVIKKIDLGFGLVKSALGIGGGAARASTSKNPIGGISQAVGSGVDLSQGFSTLGYKLKSINAEKDKAIGQINNGEVSSSTGFGFYAFISNLEITSLYFTHPNDIGYEQLFPLLHRYGYNTPLQFDEVYKNHKRQYFNYIECSTCDIDGVPLDIAGDVETMFESGVHLWNGTVGDWEVPNWQVDVYEWIKGGKK